MEKEIGPKKKLERRKKKQMHLLTERMKLTNPLRADKPPERERRDEEKEER